MKIDTIKPGEVYHIYNRTNKGLVAFKSDDFYELFMVLVVKYLPGVCNLLAYHIESNHYHFLIEITVKSIQVPNPKQPSISAFSKAMQILQSTYTQIYQRKTKFHGSLFQQRFKSQLTNNDGLEQNYLLKAYLYIIFNAEKDGLVDHIRDWEFTSYHELMGTSSLNICRHDVLAERLGLTIDEIKQFASNLRFR
jgi:putative transposase